MSHDALANIHLMFHFSNFRHELFFEWEKVKKIDKNSLIRMKEKDIVELNKHIEHNNKHSVNTDPLMNTGFTFQDKEMYKIYVDLCSKRYFV
jgi:hypothetical protein